MIDRENDFPEHEKMKKVRAESDTLSQFLDWLDGKDYWLCEAQDSEVRPFIPLHGSKNELLAEFFEIDLKKIEDEKQQMLDEIRAANKAAHG